jgi:flagellar basal-body rod modification protein FlgD
MVDATTAAAGSVTQRMNSSRENLATSEETFLALLTTQLKNQDPLSPMDSNAFTQQIVQMTGVEQQLLTNDLLSMLVGMNDGGLTNSVDLIGNSVTTENAKGVLTDGKIEFNYNLSRAAVGLKLEVVDSYGKTIRTIKPDDLSKGDKTFTWDGKADDGTQQPNGGTYTLKATATDFSGANIAVSPTSRVVGVVTAVETDAGTVMLTINGRKLPLGSVIGVTTPTPTAANDDTNNDAGEDADDTSSTPAA